MCRLLKSICVHILLKLTLMESWKSHLHKHASHIAHPPYTNTLNCRIVATLLRLHWTSLNPHKHTLILVESFVDSSYSKLRLTHSPAYPPLHLHSHLKSCCYITLTLAGIHPRLFIHTQNSDLLTHLHTLLYTYTLTCKIVATSHLH